MTRFECKSCTRPNPKVNKPDTCVQCNGLISDEWSSNDQTVHEFFKRLGDSIPAKGDAWQRFVIDCEAREFAGRKSFGFTYLERDNLREAREEACDLALYLMLDALKMVREGRAEEDFGLVLQIAFHAFQAYEATFSLAARRRGAP